MDQQCKAAYTKPMITKVALTPEEAVLTGCKGATNKTGSGCTKLKCGGSKIGT